MIPINDLSRIKGDHHEFMAAIERVVLSGNWIHGLEHESFEAELSDFIGVKYAFGVGNGTDALEIALSAVGCVQGSNVISVANAGGYASLAAKSIGCKVIYCDVDPVNLVMDPKKLKKLLTKNIDAVIVTHLFGNVAPIDEITRMCRNIGVKVIEDCAQSIGGYEKGKRLGSIGDIGTFSFYPTKNLGAFGDGGALTTNNYDLSLKIGCLRQYGWAEKYQVKTLSGMNSRLDELQAAILRIGLRSVDLNNERRRDILKLYQNYLVDREISLITSLSKDSVGHLAVVMLPDNVPRDTFMKRMEICGVQTGIHYPILDSDQPAWFNEIEQFDLDISRRVQNRIVTLPMFPKLTSSEIDKIFRAIDFSILESPVTL